ncbi:MAG: cell division protein FtsL [Candidatus Eremiobacteraeota bacterium]|jgi:cell division protein FtsL|nr:cell division protein FtsL [Candidatus Eremiobacteraeota bacterium]
MKESLARKLYYEESPAPRPLLKKKKGWPYVARVLGIYIALITSIVLIYLSFCSQVVEEQYALDNCQNQLSIFENRHLSLEIQVKKLSSLKRIGRIAEDKFKMAFPKKRMYIEKVNGSHHYKIWGLKEKIAMQ